MPNLTKLQKLYVFAAPPASQSTRRETTKRNMMRSNDWSLSFNWYIQNAESNLNFELKTLWDNKYNFSACTFKNDCHKFSCEMHWGNYMSRTRVSVKGSSFKPQLEKVFLFTHNRSIRSHFPSMGLSVTGGKITSMSAALIHMSHVSFVLRVQFSPLTEWENGREWKLNTRLKLVHYMSIFTA